MVLDPVKNFINVDVSTGYNDSATSIDLSSGDGADLPDPSTDGAFNMVWYDADEYNNPGNDPNVEIVRVTARSGDTLTITRGQEDTTASTKNTSGGVYKMLLTPTAKTINDVRDKVDAMDTAIDLNTAKVTNATHTGEVTGATTLTIANNAVVADKIANDAVTNAKIAGTGTRDATTFYRGDGTFATPAGGGGGGITWNEVTGTTQSAVVNAVVLSSSRTFVFTARPERSWSPVLVPLVLASRVLDVESKLTLAVLASTALVKSVLGTLDSPTCDLNTVRIVSS